MIGHKKKELSFTTTATWQKEKQGILVLNEYPDNLLFSCPPEFGGTELPSPEDLFLASISTCTLTTVLHLCDKLRTEPKKLIVTTIAKIRFNKTIKDYEFTKIRCLIDVNGEEFLLKRICELVPKYCIIKRSIKPEIVYEAKINSK